VCVRLPGCQKSCAHSSPPFFFLPRVFSHGPCVCRVWVTHWHRGGSNNNSGRDNNSCYAFSRFRQFMDETLTIIKPWSRRAELKLLLLLLLGGASGCPLGFGWGFCGEEACTDWCHFKGLFSRSGGERQEFTIRKMSEDESK
jgi:hypothetical protein